MGIQSIWLRAGNKRETIIPTECINADELQVRILIDEESIELLLDEISKAIFQRRATDTRTIVIGYQGYDV
jgi:hypothetical protein